MCLCESQSSTVARHAGDTRGRALKYPFELVREHPSIYNPKQYQYKDAIVRENVWMEIAALLKQPAEDCKNRWKNIRDTFMRRKRNKKLPTVSARTKKLRTWHLEEHVGFLTQVDCERETLTNAATQDTQDDNIDFESQQTEDVEMEGDPDEPENEATETSRESNITDANIANTSITGKEGKEIEAQTAYKRGKNSNRKSADNMVELLSSVLAKQPEVQHQIDIFFKSMAMSVKKMSPENQIHAKMKICQLVGRLELDEICSRSTSARLHIHLSVLMLQCPA